MYNLKNPERHIIIIYALVINTYCLSGLQAMDFLMPEGSDPIEIEKAPTATETVAKVVNMLLRNEKVKEALTVVGRANKVSSWPPKPLLACH